MDFGTYPPEINSLRMYTGPGAAPMLTAAQAWQGLAAELHSAASSYQSVVSGLTTGQWQGPASASMAAAAATYVTWLNATAAQAEETAAQAKSAAAAYQTAFTSTVPPQMVAANRESTDDAGRDEHLRPKHPGDRGQRSTVRADVGPGHRGDVRLRRFVSLRDVTDTVQPTPTEHQPRRHRRTVSRGHASHRHGGRQCAEHVSSKLFPSVPNALQSLATAAPAAARLRRPVIRWAR